MTALLLGTWLVTLAFTFITGWAVGSGRLGIDE